MTEDTVPPSSDIRDLSVREGTRRRDILATVTAGVACAGACALAYPFLDSLNGTRGSGLDEDSAIDVDFSGLHPGQQMIVTWRGWPVFVQRRTPEMLASLRVPGADQRLRDPESKVCQQPTDAANWHRSVIPEIGVLIGICTHLGCVPSYNVPAPSDRSGRYLCPCHGSQFDIAGRAYKEAPAPYNLPVPPVTIMSDTHLRIGQSKGDPDFDIANIQQI